jgi:hypothetical protein
VSVAPAAATEKSEGAWRNAKARLGCLWPELRKWVEDLELIGERDELLLLADKGEGAPGCPRCEALLGQALLPLGYRGARVLSGSELSKARRR